MKKKIIITVLICVALIGITFLFSTLSENEANVNVNDLNSGINNLLGEIPNDDINIEIEVDSKVDKEYDEYDDEKASQIKEAEEFSEALLKTSEDVIPKNLNFSFYEYSLDVPETIEYHGNQFVVELTDYISTEISMFNPSVFLTTFFVFEEDNFDELNESYKNLYKGIINDCGEIIAGKNYELLDLSNVDENFATAMIFECSDCYVAVRAMYFEDSEFIAEGEEVSKAVMVNIAYVSKFEYHLYNGSDYYTLQFIEGLTNARFNYYYYDENGVSQKENSGYFNDMTMIH